MLIDGKNFTHRPAIESCILEYYIQCLMVTNKDVALAKPNTFYSLFVNTSHVVGFSKPSNSGKVFALIWNPNDDNVLYLICEIFPFVYNKFIPIWLVDGNNLCSVFQAQIIRTYFKAFII